MNKDHAHGDSPEAFGANTLAALLLRRMNAVLNSQPIPAPHFTDDPYLTPAVLDTYNQLADMASLRGEALNELEVGLSLPEAGRLLQLCIESAMRHAGDNHGREPWFTCMTGIDVVYLGTKVFLGIAEEAAKR